MALRILTVDDSPAMRGFVRRVIELSGLDVTEVLEAGDGIAALRLLDKEWVDVILTDINMPNMGGEELVRRLAEAGVAAATPVIIVSTDGTETRKEQMRALGARGYVVKPFTPEELRNEVERVLGWEDQANA